MNIKVLQWQKVSTRNVIYKGVCVSTQNLPRAILLNQIEQNKLTWLNYELYGFSKHLNLERKCQLWHVYINIYSCTTLSYPFGQRVNALLRVYYYFSQCLSTSLFQRLTQFWSFCSHFFAFCFSSKKTLLFGPEFKTL